MAKPLGINWQICSFTGWGIFGLHLCLRMIRRGLAQPVFFHQPVGDFTSEQLEILKQAGNGWDNLAKVTGNRPGVVGVVDFPVVHALGNDLMDSGKVKGRINDGIIFFEDTNISPAGWERGKQYRKIIAGSSWNGEVLARKGFDNVTVCLQGIDETVFFPGEKKGRFKDRFVVFSGGKLEYRKGQDIVIAAFAKFRQKYPDALLVTAWANTWPHIIKSIMLSPHITTPLEFDAKGYPIYGPWLAAHEIPAESFIDLGFIHNYQTGEILREIDVGVFPNRCEGGTNLVAMEALASGVPCIIAANTGQLDLTRNIPCYPLREQAPVDPSRPQCGTEDWGESSVDEIVARLEYVYHNRLEASLTGRRAAMLMRSWSHPLQSDKIIAQLL